ncbi:MAG: hypothetical protein ABFS86_09450 [Planctomycetota bacterium]
MNRALLWREWQEMASPVCWLFAGAVFLGVLTRFVDEVVGLSIAGAAIAIVIGNAATGSDRSPRIREFLLTRPANRGRILCVKTALAFGTLNAFLFGLGTMIWLDLPARFFHLFVESTLGERVIHTDVPVFYPAGILYANLVLAIVLYARIFARNPATGPMLGIVLTLVTGLTVQRVLSGGMDRLGLIALTSAALFLVAIAVLMLRLRKRFEVLEVTGGGS